MKPSLYRYNVRAHCPNCGGTLTTFEFKHEGNEHGSVIVDGQHLFNGEDFSRIIYRLLRCAGCGHAGLSKVHYSNNDEGPLEVFYPMTIVNATIPISVPEGIANEFREAELCASVAGWRAASALLRSTLEKTLKENGYTTGNLQKKIDDAAGDGILTDSRRKRAQDDIRVLGNDVLHDDWREVTEEEYEVAHQYTQRILEDFYDDRASVESVLTSKGRLSTTP